MRDEIRFLQNHRPGLQAGDYEITVEQDVKSSKIAFQPPFTTTRKGIPRNFSVRSERFALKPADVQAVFPPVGSLGDHSAVLPHILLHRSTLPWERSAADPPNPETPWLALLLFYEGEVPQPKIVSLKDLPIVPERGQNNDDKVTVIDIKCSVLQGLLPSKDELAMLTHVREATDYVITEHTLAMLKSDGVPNEVRLKLQELKDQEFIGADVFLEALQKTIDVQQRDTYQETIAKQAAAPIELAVIIGNRLPQPKGLSTVHLVSVEGRYKAEGFDYQAGEHDFVRLVSLHSWRFACIDHQQSFSGLLTRLNCTPSTLRLPDSSARVANEYLALGALPLRHRLRQGAQTVSWYHGPLAPAENRLLEDDPSAPDLPVRAADALLRYNPTTGMFDVSYAAAWELGRLLALQSKSFSVSLYNWKRARTQQIRQIEEEVLHASPLDDGAGPPIPIPPAIVSWFKRLSLLEGVPFSYLVPDERLLPLESIRFFQMDWLWIDCLLDGAFSIGRVMAQDHRRDSAHDKSPAARSHAHVSGLLMRSDVVAGWPGLLVDGFNGKTKLPLLRMDRLSANVLLCLFEGEATAVDLHLRPEMVHFGLDQTKGIPASFCKELRDQQGNESGLQIKTIPFRQTPLGTLDVSALATTIKQTVDVSTFTSAQFALQMIETSEKVRFSLPTA